MPLPTQPTLYDISGVPISVDPRIPGLNRVESRPILDPPHTFQPLKQKFDGLASNTSTSTTKRNASDDTQEDINKRVKSERIPFPLESPAPITAPPPTPVSTSPNVSFRSTPGAFVADCAANGINLTPAGSSLARQSKLPCPPWPVEAIDTLVQASEDLLLALVRKGAADREKDLLVGVGTLRTCLDVEFKPHREAWKADAEDRARQLSRTIPSPPLSAIIDSLKPHLSITIPKQPVHTPPTPKVPDSAGPLVLGIPSSREALRSQLAGARATIDKQAQELKQKDDEIARSKEENKRLNARLAQLSAQSTDAIQPAQSRPAGPVSANEIATLHRFNREHIEKLNNQKGQVRSLLAQNARLKEKLTSAGFSLDGMKGERHDDEKSDIGRLNERERSGTGWDVEGESGDREHLSRTVSSRNDIVNGSYTSSDLATPVIENESRMSSDTRRNPYSSFAKHGKRGHVSNDPRSHWERSNEKRNIGPPSPPRSAPPVPTGPRYPHVKVEPEEIVGHQPQYMSENWRDYCSEDGFGGMQADRLDFE